MAYSAIAVANEFIERHERGELCDLTPMKLQKLLFYTQSWHLKLHNGTPLLDDLFARWKYGPVIPSLYHELKKYGSCSIREPIRIIQEKNESLVAVTPGIQKSDIQAHRLISKIIEVYGGYTGTELSNMTHSPNAAWSKGDADGGPISFREMAEFIH